MSPVTPTWQQRAAELKPDGRAFVAGQRVTALAAATFAKHSPIDGRLLAHIADCQSADIDVAVADARAAFSSGVWSARAPVARKRVLQRFAELIRAHKDELALLETLDMGKPIGDSLRSTCRAPRAR